MKNKYLAVALMCVSTGLHAKIQHTSLSTNNKLTLNSVYGQGIELDIDKNQQGDELFARYNDWSYLSTPRDEWFVHFDSYNINTNSWPTSFSILDQKNSYQVPYIHLLQRNDTIDSNLKFSEQGDRHDPLLGDTANTHALNTGRRYAGFRIEMNSANHYGWIEFEFKHENGQKVLEVFAYAIEDQSNQFILAGDTGSNTNPILINSIQVSTSSGLSTIDQLAGTLQMNASVLPANATNKELEWSVDDPSVASIDTAGMLTAHSNGQVLVSVVAKDGSGATSSLHIDITNQSNGVLHSQKHGLKVSLIEDLLLIKSKNTNHRIVRVWLYGTNGYRIYHSEVEAQSHRIPLPNSGISLLTVEFEDGNLLSRKLFSNN